MLRNNYATLLMEHNDPRGAMAQLREAIARDPGYAAAWSNLGSLLGAAGDTVEAEKAFLAAINADPANPVHLLDLARVHLASGQVRLADHYVEQADAVFAKDTTKRRNEFTAARADLALAMALAQRKLGNRLEEFKHVKRAVEFGAGTRAKQYFVAALDGVEFIQPWPALKSLLSTAFEQNWGFADELGKAAAKQLLVEPDYRELLARASTATLDAEDARIVRAASDRLLLQLLTRTIVTHPELEHLLTGVRRAILSAFTSELPENQRQKLLPLVVALASQCFANGYAWLMTAEESTAVDRLARTVEKESSSSPFTIGLLGCYVPLAGLTHLGPLPPVLDGLAKSQLHGPREEKRIRGEIRAITPTRNPVSDRVKAQYEEDPYPLWLEPPRQPSHVDPTAWLAQNFPAAPVIELGPARPLRILVTGCGTGSEPVGLSLALADATITAIDLSVSSLAYAIRKTRELGIANIEYFQGDLLELDPRIGPFDVVVSAGVLHHLENPLAGWRKLTDLTRPGGYQMIALYSTLARRHIVEAQVFAAQGGYDASRDSLRRFRHDVYSLPESPAWRTDLLSRDEFYTLSMLRDLVFHVQEHRFTTETLSQALDELGLEFGGFTVDVETDHLFRMKFGAETNPLSLAQWGAFEVDYPDTFTGMYHFLCRRPR